MRIVVWEGHVRRSCEKSRKKMSCERVAQEGRVRRSFKEVV
jgi:hypothetical protein